MLRRMFRAFLALVVLGVASKIFGFVVGNTNTLTGSRFVFCVMGIVACFVAIVKLLS